jgi:hypothetical protein
MRDDGGGSSFFVVIIELAIAVLVIASLWRVFTKAGQPGWAAIIPIYNAYILCKIAGKPGWWVILMLIPIVNLVILLLVSLGVSENFGKSGGFGVGLWLLGFIFYPILAFGDAQYRPVAVARATA